MIFAGPVRIDSVGRTFLTEIESDLISLCFEITSLSSPPPHTIYHGSEVSALIWCFRFNDSGCGGPTQSRWGFLATDMPYQGPSSTLSTSELLRLYESL